MIGSLLKNIPYKLVKERKSTIAHFHAFGCKAYMLNNNKDNLEKFNAKSNEGIFDDYSTPSKACRVFNKYYTSC